MRILFSWLKEFIEISLHPETLAERLTMAGLEVTSLERLNGDWVFELEVTPNRPDLLSHLGIAREVAAILGRNFRFPRRLKKEMLPLPLVNPPVSIKIEDTEGCYRYTGIVMEGIQVRPSPPEVAQRLTLLGVRPVNNVVDATNLCLFELGQPLHAFDLDRLEGFCVRVRRATSKEKLVTIDGEVRELKPEILVIADQEKPVALAGIMGGKESEISPTTHRILLESAWFEPTRIRKGTRILGLSSESSYRFERGVDPASVSMAAYRAARLICRLTEGRMTGGPSDVGEARVARRGIRLRPRMAQDLLGVRISFRQQVKTLTRLGCQVRGNSFGLRVEPPSYRADLQIPEDLIEELARLFGYERCPLTLLPVPRQSLKEEEATDLWFDQETVIRQLVRGAGLQEIVTYSLVDPKDQAKVKLIANPIELSNPLSGEHSVLRQTLLMGALKALSLNLHRKTGSSFCLFEMGNVYQATLTPPEEKRLGILVAGAPLKEWRAPATPWDLFSLKGIIQLLAQRLGLPHLSETVESGPAHFLAPSVKFQAGEEELGFAGELDPQVLASFEIPEEIKAAYAELRLKPFMAQTPILFKLQSLPKVAPVVRDVAIVLSEEIPYQKVSELLLQTGAPLVKDLQLFDLYRGSQIPSGKKSLAFHLEFSAGDRTLTEAEVNASFQRIVEELKERLQATLR